MTEFNKGMSYAGEDRAKPVNSAINKILELVGNQPPLK